MSKDLHVYMQKNTKTLQIMDEFVDYKNNGDNPYDRIIIDNLRSVQIGSYNIQYSLIIIKLDELKNKCFIDEVRFDSEKFYNSIEGNITFSKFRNNPEPVYEYMDECLKEMYLDDLNILKKDEILIKKPFLLRAQSTYQREGYGWEWDWSGGRGTYFEGTEYGETEEYGFVGVLVVGKQKVFNEDEEKQRIECLKKRYNSKALQLIENFDGPQKHKKASEIRKCIVCNENVKCIDKTKKISQCTFCGCYYKDFNYKDRDDITAILVGYPWPKAPKSELSKGVFIVSNKRIVKGKK